MLPPRFDGKSFARPECFNLKGFIFTVALLALSALPLDAQVVMPTSVPSADVGMASNAPAPALSVGYTTENFNSTTWGTTIGTLQSWNFFGNTVPARGIVQNGNGSLTLTGNSGNPYGVTVSTAAYNAANPQHWQGIAFGGGAYIQVTFSYAGTQSGDQMAMWLLDILSTSGYTPEVQGYSGIEIDGPEFDVPGSTAKYGISCHNYYYNKGAKGTANPGVLTSKNSPITIGSGSLSGSNTYGTLWVPATPSTQGYLKWFFNNQQVGPTVSWNQYNGGQGFPPTGSNVCNVLDNLRIIPMIGTSNTLTPMTITSVQVWQGSGANNVTADGQVLTVTRSGAVAHVDLSASSISFGADPRGEPTSSQRLLVSNSGRTSLTLDAINLTGAAAGSFAHAGSCSAGLALGPGASCYLLITFDPRSTGALAATLQIGVIGGAPVSVALTGTGSAVRATDGPLPIWALGALGMSLVAVARRRLRKAA